MGTETRVGIVAGLLIVVIASLYFYYGQSRPDQDILIANNSTVSPPPKIPVGTLIPQGDRSAASDKLAMHSPVKPAGAPAISSRGGGPIVSAAQAKPAVTPVLVQAPLPKPIVSAPIFPPVSKAPLKADKPDINGDSSEDTGDLSESSWDHLAAAPSSTPKSAPVTAPPTTPAPTKLASANSVHQLSTPGSNSTLGATGANDRSKSGASPSNAKDQSWPRKHKVAKGETLSGISFAYYEDHNHINEILSANPQLKSPKALRIGQVLEIPAPKVASNSTKSVDSAAQLASAAEPHNGFISLIGRSSNITPTEEKKPVATPEKPATAVTGKPQASDQTYTTRDGDTFYSIAKKVYGDGKKWQRVYDANKSVVKNNPKGLRKGMTLTIPR